MISVIIVQSRFRAGRSLSRHHLDHATVLQVLMQGCGIAGITDAMGIDPCLGFLPGGSGFNPPLKRGWFIHQTPPYSLSNKSQHCAL